MNNTMESKKKNKKPSTDKNYVKKTVKFLPKDYENVADKMNKTQMDFSTLVKHVLLKSEVITIELKPKADEELLSLIKYISNNLNQLTKALHTSIGVSNEPLIKHNIALIGLMEKDINKIKSKLLK